MRLNPPASLSAVSRVLEEAGFESWAVGGAVRDTLLSIEPSEWDLATDARPDEVLALFPRTVPLGIEHGTVGVLDEAGVLYQVTTFRRDVETDGRHAVVAFADTIEEDLARRFRFARVAQGGVGFVQDPVGCHVRTGKLGELVRFGDCLLVVLQAEMDSGQSRVDR